MAQAPHFGVPPGGLRPHLRPLTQGAGSAAAARPAALHHGMPAMPSVQYASLQQRQMQQHGHVQQQQLLAQQQVTQAQAQQQQQQQLQQQAQAQAQAQRMQLLHQQQMQQQSQQAQAQSQQAAQAQRGSLGLAAHPSQAVQQAQQLQVVQHQAQHAQAAVAAQHSQQLAHVQAQHAAQQSVQHAQAHAVAQQQHAAQLHEAAYAEQQQLLHAHAQQLQQQQQAQQMQQAQHEAAVREANLHAQQAAAASAKMSPEVAAAETRLSQAKERLWLRIGGMRSSFGDADGALEAFQAVLQHNPVNATALTQAATVLAKQEQYNLAENLLQRSLAVQPACGEAWAVLAHCYVMTDQLQPAYLAYQNALSYLPNPKDPTLWYGIGLLYDRYGWLNHALEAFKSVLDIAPDFERADEVCFCMGIIFKEQGDYKSALEYFDRVVAAASPPPPLSSADALYQIGLVHDLTGDKPTAEATFRRALEANPSHAKSLNQLAWLRHLSGDVAEALVLLHRSVEVDGNDGQVWYLLGRVRMTRREYREAHEAYQKAVFSDSRNHVYWCSIGVLYFQMGQHKDALDAYTRAIRITPNVGDVWLALGRLYETCHQPNDALDAYGRALDLSPGDTAISARLDLIRNYMETGGPPPALPDPPADGPLAMSAMMAARTAVAFGPGGGPVPGAVVGGVPAPAAGFGALMQLQATSTQADLAPAQALAGRSEGLATAGGADQGDDSDRDAEHQAPCRCAPWVVKTCPVAVPSTPLVIAGRRRPACSSADQGWHWARIRTWFRWLPAVTRRLLWVPLGLRTTRGFHLGRYSAERFRHRMECRRCCRRWVEITGGQSDRSRPGRTSRLRRSHSVAPMLMVGGCGHLTYGGGQSRWSMPMRKTKSGCRAWPAPSGAPGRICLTGRCLCPRAKLGDRTTATQKRPQRTSGRHPLSGLKGSRRRMTATGLDNVVGSSLRRGGMPLSASVTACASGAGRRRRRRGTRGAAMAAGTRAPSAVARTVVALASQLG
eukprot:TRINITY_DN341_c0_g1_i1.p1 TRINITY_DN341_c0_g1~~TRINITY_DN341_c0_g1_i1.p1  ORF type:complete len:1006 (+),score=197.33 TRINITY_DN341_c0_g1_i1:414-3431(+)